MSVDGVRVFYRRVPGEGTPVVYCHGNPTHGEDWVPFMERGGPAIAIDMPGWGRSDRPSPDRFDYSMYGLSAFLERCLDELGVEQRKLVVHDWGGLALIGAQRRPELVEKLVVDQRGAAAARLPLALGGADLAPPRRSASSPTRPRPSRRWRLIMRQARGDRSPMPPEFVDMIWRHWDKGTQRRHPRPLPPRRPRRASPKPASDLGKLTCPALVLWGDRDIYLPTKFAEAYAEALPNAELEIVPGAGHWPWIDDPRSSTRPRFRRL